MRKLTLGDAMLHYKKIMESLVSDVKGQMAEGTTAGVKVAK